MDELTIDNRERNLYLLAQPLEGLGLRCLGIGWMAKSPHHCGDTDRTLPFFGLNIIVDGDGFFSSDQTPRRGITVGDAFVLRPGVRHWYGPGEGCWEEYWLYMDGPLVQSLIGDGEVHSTREVISLFRDKAAGEELKDRFEDTIILCRDGGSGAAAAATTLIYSILSRMYVGPSVGTASSIGLIAAEIDKDPLRPWDFHALAREGGMSYSSLRQRFKQELGTSPGAYLSRKRMHEAAKLLAEGISVKEAARVVGMADPYHFSRLFKQVFGRSPKQWTQAWQLGLM